jgi:hypothetical protein
MDLGKRNGMEWNGQGFKNGMEWINWKAFSVAVKRME